MHTRTTRLIATSLFAVVFAVAGLSVAPQNASAASVATLSGYAWSSTIGWISFNGANYGVSVDAAGNLSGYAWSSNIGWVSFNQTSGCPESGCTTQPKIDPTTGVVSGWALALANGGGWDGWSKLGGPWSNSVVFSSNAATGYSWGADVVGWVSWDGVTKTVTTCSNGANNPLACTTCTLPLVWDSVSLSCVPQPPSVDCLSKTINHCDLLQTHPGFTSGTCSLNYSGTCNYSCTNTNGTWSLNSNSCVAGPISCTTPWGTTVADGASVQAFQTPTVISPATCVQQTRACTNGTLSGSYANQNCTVVPPTVTISASPSRVQSGNTWTLKWRSTGVSACSITGTNGFSLPGAGTSGTHSTNAITAQTTFTISCDSGAATGTTIVNIVPAFQEF